MLFVPNILSVGFFPFFFFLHFVTSSFCIDVWLLIVFALRWALAHSLLTLEPLPI